MKSPKSKQIMSDANAEALLTRLSGDIDISRTNNKHFIDQVYESRRMMQYDQPVDGQLENERHNDDDDEEGKNDWRSKLVVPYCKSTKLTLMSYLIPLLVDPDPIFSYNPNNTKSKVYTHACENNKQAQLSRIIKYRPFITRAIDATATDGAAVIRVIYKEKRELMTVWNDKYEPEEKEVVVYDAPELTLVPIEDFGTFPRANWPLDRTPGVFCVQNYTGAEIEELGRMDEELGGFRMDAVEKMRTMPPDDNNNQGTTDEPDAHEVGSYERDIDVTTTETDFLSGTYTLTEIFWSGALTYDDSDNPEGKLAPHIRMVCHIPSNTVLSVTKNPWWHGRAPFVVLQMLPDRDGLAGDSIRTSGAGHIQSSITKLARGAEDSMMLGIDPPTYESRATGLDGEAFHTGYRPGGRIAISESFFENKRIEPVYTSKLNPNEVQTLISAYDLIGQKCTGATDQLKQSPDATQMSATEAQQVMETQQSSLLYLANNIAIGLQELGDMLHALDVQFMGNAGPQALWEDVNGELMLPPVEVPPSQQSAPQGIPQGIPQGMPQGIPQGMPQGMQQQQQPMPPPPPQPITMQDAFTKGSYTITCNGVRDTANKFVRLKRSIESMQIAQADPTIWSQAPLRYHYIYDVLKSSGVADPAKLMGELVDYVKADADIKAKAQADKDHSEQFMLQVEQIKHKVKDEAPQDPHKAGKEAFEKAVGTAAGDAIGLAIGANINPQATPQEQQAVNSIIPGIMGAGSNGNKQL